MPRARLDELAVFAAVARLCSFRLAAVELGVSTSAVSHALRGLEERLGTRLLNRTTRSVALTERGEQLLARLGPALAEIDAALDALGEAGGRPSGTLRINAPRLAAAVVLGPVLGDFARSYPDVVLEIAVDDGLADIVGQRYDAGLRFGEVLEADMVAVRVSRDMEMAVVASPAYLATHPAPLTPHDLRGHTCVQRRLRGSGGLYRWEFEKDGEELRVAVDGPLVLDDGEMMVRAALDGVGLVYTGLDYVTPLLAQGRLVRVLADWCPPWPGFYLYHPSRRHVPAALRALIAMLQARGAVQVGKRQA